MSICNLARLRLATLLCMASALPAAERWIRVTTPHFEMLTTNNEKQAIRALQTFEQVRYFFLKNNGKQQAPEGPVRILAFSSEKEYKPYRMNEGAFAYYLQSRERDYIVMQDIETEHHQSAIHEYTHLIVQHTKLEWPLWLNEGFADLYSSLEPRGKQAMVGRALPGRVATLLQRPWMDWNTLFAVDHSSPFYNEREKMAIFYAQSWMLTHMLALSPAYIPKFSEFLAVISQGNSTADALRKVYGKSVSEIAKQVATYAHQTSFRAAIFDVTLSSSDLTPKTTDLPAFDTDLALADLLASRKETQPEARRRLLALSQQNTQSSAVEESLGYLAWQSNDIPEARKHFTAASDRGSNSVHMLYDLAMLDQMSDAALDASADLLDKIIVLQPDHTDACILLAEVESRRHHLAKALRALSLVHTVQPDQAYRFFAISAYTHSSLHDLNGGRQLAEKALSYAKTPTQKSQIEGMLQSMSASGASAAAVEPASIAAAQPKPDPAENPGSPPSENPVPVRLARSEGLPRVSGTTKTFECVKGAFRLHVQSQAREMIFAMPDPKEVVVRNINEVVWSCGPLPPRDVTVIYKPANSSTSDGTVSELIFSPGSK